LSEFFLSGRFCSGWFLPVPLLSEYIRYNRKPHTTFNFRLSYVRTNLKSVTSHALGPSPLSQTVTPSRNPSPLERDVLYERLLFFYFILSLSLSVCLSLSQLHAIFHTVYILQSYNNNHYRGFIACSVPITAVLQRQYTAVKPQLFSP